MIITVIGGSGSGKSTYAEKRICQLAENTPKYYIATMRVYDEEGRRKVDRHRRLRKEKQFETIEQMADLAKLKFADKDSKTAFLEANRKAGLLECISNLVANEMFKEDGKILLADEVCDKVLADLKHMMKQFSDLIIVTNQVFSDGCQYEKSTLEYIRCMGMVNQHLAKMSDEVVEVVAGIPLLMKGKEKK